MSKIGSNRNTSSSPFDQVCASVVEELFSPKLPPLFYLFSDMGYVFFLPCLLGMWHAFIGSMHLSTLGGTSFLDAHLSFYLFFLPCLHGSWIFSLMAHPRGFASFIPHFFIAHIFLEIF
jgi:hypothetical protein